MKIKTVLFVLLLGFIAFVIVGTNNSSDLEKATVHFDKANNIAYINVTPDEGGNVELTTDEILQKVTEKNIDYINVIYDSDKDGSLYIFGDDGKKGFYINAIRRGDGEGNAGRDGASDGNAKRLGAGDGAAIRAGAGNGDAIRDGDGKGGAWRGDAGDGNALRDGAGDGAAIRDGAGAGDAYTNGVKQ